MSSSSSSPLKENMTSSSNPPSKENHKEKKKSWIPYDIGIMIIDEDPTSLLFVHTLLKTCHYRVMSYEDPAEALADLYRRSNEIDLVIADLHLITMPCLSLVQKVAKLFKLPVITTCVDEDPQLLRLALACGSCFHLVKPITIRGMEFVWRKSWQRKSKNTIDQYPRLYNLHQPNLPVVHGGHANSRGKEIVQVGKSASANVNSKRKGKGQVSKKQVKNRLEWENDLHTRFLVAISLLGEDAVPTNIIGIMNVHGLSVKQVASHLQKHRGRVIDEKGAEEKLKSKRSRRSSTVGKFPTRLIPAGSKRTSINALEENLQLSTKKNPMILPKTTFQLEIPSSSAFPASSSQNPWSLAIPELCTLRCKQRKKPGTKRAPQKSTTVTTHHQPSTSFGIPILNSFDGEIIMFDPSVLSIPFQFVGQSSEGNADPEIMHNDQVVELDSSEGMNTADPVVIHNQVELPIFLGNADPVINMRNQVLDDEPMVLEGNAGPEIMHSQVEEPVLFGNANQVEEPMLLAEEGWLGLMEGFPGFDGEDGSSNELAGLECDINYKYRDVTFDDEMLNEMFEKIDKEG